MISLLIIGTGLLYLIYMIMNWFDGNFIPKVTNVDI